MRIRLTDSVPRGAALSRIAFLCEGKDPAAGVPVAVRAAIQAAVRKAGFRGKEGEVASGPGPDWTLVGLGKPPVPAARLRLDAAPRRPGRGPDVPEEARPVLRRRAFGDRVPRAVAADQPRRLRLRPLQVVQDEEGGVRWTRSS